MVPTKIQTWPCRKTAVGSAITKSTVNVIDYEGVRTAIDGIANNLFKQDGTVELLACRWSEREKLRPTPIFSYDELDTYIEKNITTKPISKNPPSIRNLTIQLSPNQVPQTHILHAKPLTYQSCQHEPLTTQPVPNQDFIIPAPSPPSTHLFLIDQNNTKSSLDITREGLNLLLSRIDAFTQLGNALPAFVASDIPIHEGNTAFNARRSISSSGAPAFELCMLLKYVEPNGNKSDPIPYSVRQQLLYQNFGFGNSSDQEALVLFRVSAVLKRRITEEFLGCSGWTRHWSNVPLLAVSSLNCYWGEYCKFLDEGVWRIDKSSTHTNPFLPSLGEANTKTLQATQKYHDVLTRAIHVLQNNIWLSSSLSKESSKRKTLEQDCPNYNAEYYEVLDTIIEDTKKDLEGFTRHLVLIQARLSRITEGIRDSIALRSSHHAAVETQNMRNLTAQSIREARTVKAIALVTLIYLPATFVATFLGMNTIDVTNEGHALLTVAVDPEMWVYLALTIPLTLCTLAAWWVWEWWSRRTQPESVGVSWKEEEGEA